MRLLVLFLVCSIGLTYAADSYAQKALISIDVRNQRVEDILKEIEEQSDFDFFFNNKHVDLNRRVSVSADKSNIFSVLKEIFSGTNVKYSVLDKKIILSIEAQSPEQEKKITVSGTISDAQGEPIIGASVLEKGVQVRGDERVCALNDQVIPATEEDWGTEYLDSIISVKTVDSFDEAVEHINHYNTGHSEAIVTDSYQNAQEFLNQIDAAAVYVNASTRFTDGFEFGFGAEIGISTQKIHARGPMGLDALTTSKFIIYGNGQIRK